MGLANLQPHQHTQGSHIVSALVDLKYIRMNNPLQHRSASTTLSPSTKITLKINLRVVGKAPRAALRRLQIHKATGKNVANPRAGRCRCIFGGLMEERRDGERSLEEAAVEVVVATPSQSVSLASLFRTDGEEPRCFGPPLSLPLRAQTLSLSLSLLSLSLSHSLSSLSFLLSLFLP